MPRLFLMEDEDDTDLLGGDAASPSLLSLLSFPLSLSLSIFLSTSLSLSMFIFILLLQHAPVHSLGEDVPLSLSLNIFSLCNEPRFILKRNGHPFKETFSPLLFFDFFHSLSSLSLSLSLSLSYIWMWVFQEMGMGTMNPPMETMAPSTRPQLTERRPRPHKEQPLSCPRCHSTNTKFCYYNNYSLTQPRYFCKTCRRYWTEGGSLRNVPIGGGSRKNKRHSSTPKPISSSNPSSSSPQSFPSSSRRSDLLPPPAASSSFRNPKFHEERGLQFGFSSMELGPLVPDYAPAFGLQDLRSAVEVGYPMEAVYGGIQGEAVQENGLKRGFFPFEDLNFEQSRSQEGGASALWNGFNGQGSW